jgi:subtilisin family serine protease
MTKKLAFAILVAGLSLLLAGCTALFAPPPAEGEGVAPAPAGATPAAPDPRAVGEAIIPPDAEYFPDRLIIAYTNDPVGEAAFAEALALVGTSVLDQVELEKVVIALVDLKNTLSVPEALGLVDLFVTGRLDPESPLPIQGIVFVEPDYNIPPPEPVPPGVDVTGLEPKIYADDPTRDLRPFQWGHDAVNAEDAWNYATGDGIIVAVFDTGVDGTHPDLQGQLVPGVEVRGMATLVPTANNDTDNHGTHVAGIIAGDNDEMGIVGLAYNAKIMDIRIFDPVFIGALNYLRGVMWAVANGADVMNNSWGGTTYSHTIKAAVDYALAHDVVVVASAGNDTRAVWFRPASIPGAIAVAASNAHNRKADFSTPGPWMSVAAPGVRVLSAVRSQTMQPGTGVPLLYDYYDGTSMSGPYVAALAAMILEKHPTASPYQVKKLIERTARDIGAPGFDDGTGHGLIRANRALATSLPADNGGALRVHVVTASSQPVRGVWFPVPDMDLTLLRGGRVVGVGQTDFEGWFHVGFPVGDYAPGVGLGYFPVLEPGTYDIVIGGDDTRRSPMIHRTANRVTARATVTVTAGGVTTVTIPVNTTLEVTLDWSGGDATTLIDLVVEEPHPATWRRASAPGTSGTWTPDMSGASGTETYTLLPVHGDYAYYRLAVEYVSGARPTSVTVTVRQNTVVETYTIPLTTPGWYYAFLSAAHRWPGWWDTSGGPFVF